LPCPVTEPKPPYNGGALPMAKSTRVYTAQLIPHPPTHNRRHTLTGTHTHTHTSTHTRDAAGAAVSQVSFLPPAETCFDVVWCPGLVRESGALPSATATNDGEILILRSGPTPPARTSEYSEHRACSLLIGLPALRWFGHRARECFVVAVSLRLALSRGTSVRRMASLGTDGPGGFSVRCSQRCRLC
jgi:hypothetical protein